MIVTHGTRILSLTERLIKDYNISFETALGYAIGGMLYEVADSLNKNGHSVPNTKDSEFHKSLIEIVNTFFK